MQISREQAIEWLQKWRREEITLWVNFTAGAGAAGLMMLAQITDVSACLVFRSEAAILRIALDKARFEYGPLQALLIPSGLGVVAAVSARKQTGLAPGDGLHIRLESGLSLFICENTGQGQHALDAAELIEGWPQRDE
ncbi:MAG: hypothetical protein U0Z53_23880 [Blastocatellia bacterium]